MDVLSEEWMRAANDLLATFETGTVDEFRFRLRFSLSDAGGRSADLVVERGSASFQPAGVDPDTTIELPTELFRSFVGGATSLLADAYDQGSVRIDGNFSKLKLVHAGLLLGRDPERAGLVLAL
jgi:hypothetical protein